MDTRDAFDAVLRELGRHPRKVVVDSFFDEKVFGNFWITYDQGVERLSVVNDRGQLVLYDGPNGDHFVRTLLKDLHNADQQAVLRAVTD